MHKEELYKHTLSSYRSFFVHYVVQAVGIVPQAHGRHVFRVFHVGRQRQNGQVSGEVDFVERREYVYPDHLRKQPDETRLVTIDSIRYPFVSPASRDCNRFLEKN